MALTQKQIKTAIVRISIALIIVVVAWPYSIPLVMLFFIYGCIAAMKNHPMAIFSSKAELRKIVSGGNEATKKNPERPR